MSMERTGDSDEFVVDVTGKRLLDIVKKILQAGPEQEKAIIDEFGEVSITLSLRDAEAIKASVTRAVASRTRGAAPSMDALASAMPQDFDHCQRRRRS